jgi:hypothetical protein
MDSSSLLGQCYGNYKASVIKNRQQVEYHRWMVEIV